MKLSKLLIYDVKQGFHYNRLKYLISAAAMGCALVWLWFSLREGYRYGWIQDTPMVADVLLYLLRGMPVYYPHSGQYVLPVIWLLLQTMIFFITAYYPRQDIYQFGQQIFLRAYKKTEWWYSKCIWCLLSVTAFYAMTFAIAVLACILLGGSLSSGFSVELAEHLYGADLSPMTEKDLWFHLLLMPWAVSACLSLFQNALSLYVEPVIGYVAVMGIMIASTYSASPFLLGNYSMILHSRVLDPNGVDACTGLIASGAVSAAAVVVGAFRIRRFDILAKG